MEPRNSKKILIISSEFPPDVGGIGNHAYNLATHLSDEGYAVTVLADLISVKSTDKKIVNVSPAFTFYPVYRSGLALVTYFERILKAIKICKNNEIIICSGKFSLWLAQLLKPIYPTKKYIAIAHGSELLLPNKAACLFTHRALKNFNSIIAVSNFTKKLLPEKILNSSAVFVIPNGINNAQFSSVSSTAAHSHHTSSISIITVGSITERKGQENVIRAMPEIMKYFPNIHYHIVGKRFLKAKLDVLINALNLQDNISFYGVVEPRELIRLLQEAHVKLMLSNNTSKGDVEGFGISILEANALGKPAIGSKNTGIEDAIKDGVTGKLVNAKDASAVAKALYEIMNDYQYYLSNALRWAKEHDWKIIIKQYVEIINSPF